MIFEVVTFELPKQSWALPVVAIYKKKVQPFVPFEVRFLKTGTQSRKNSMEARKVSSNQILDVLDEKALKICIDERGKSLDSMAFSKVVARGMESGKQKVQWVVGGPYGVDDRLRNVCDVCIALSPLIMNQEVALTVTLEQLYRAFTIRQNLPYHNL